MIKFETTITERHTPPNGELKIEYTGSRGYNQEPEVHIILTRPHYNKGEPTVTSGTFPVKELYRVFDTLDRISSV